MNRIYRRFFFLPAFLFLPHYSADAQGRQEDYQRSNTLGQQVAGKVYRAAVQPHWIDEERFWYRNDLPGGRREFVLVDPSASRKKPAFDQARLASALSRKLGKPVDPERLPIDAIAFGNNSQTLLIQIQEKVFAWNTSEYSLADSEAVLGHAQALSPETGPASSRNNGPNTILTFINHAGETVSLLWMDAEGAPHSYGSLQPDERRSQNTYSGHVWRITRQDGHPLALFVASDTPSVAVIEKDSPRPERPREREPGLSPDGKWRAFLQNNNVSLRDMQFGQQTPLTQDGAPGDSYEGELYWSPDSRKLIVFKTSPAQEHKVYFVESSPADQVQPKLHSIDYLKPGDRIAHSRPHLLEIPTRRDIPIPDALFANPWEIDQVSWDADGSRFTFLYNQRGHQVLRLIAVNATTGAAQALIDEQSSTFIDWTNKVFLHRLSRTQEAIWMSERDGWNHLYLYDTRLGSVKNQITRGEWVVRGVDRVDEDRRQIWFRAGGIVPGQDPYYVHYCRINFDGTGLTVLTSGDGTHSITLSPNGKYLVDTWSRVDMPPAATLQRVSDGKKTMDLEQGDATSLLQTGWKYPERFAARGRDGKTDIYGVICRPTHFDPSRKYPILEDIYAGPQGSFVPKSFSPASGLQAMAELGFIVVQIDGMGTNYRSKAFHDVCWKNLSDAGFPDRILWIKAAAAKYPYMDLTRIGIYGTSAGGQNALSGLLFHGDFYKAGVADCGCQDNRMDKIWWNEQWMGWPVGPEYAANSNVTHASQLQGKLLLMVGEMDTNVDPASTLQVVNALIKANKDFELLVSPGTGHGVAGTPYGRRRLQDFFVRNLLGVEPRAR